MVSSTYLPTVRDCIKSVNLLRCFRTQSLRLLLRQLVPAFSTDTVLVFIDIKKNKVSARVAVILALDIWFSNILVNWRFNTTPFRKILKLGALHLEITFYLK